MGQLCRVEAHLGRRMHLEASRSYRLRGGALWSSATPVREEIAGVTTTAREVDVPKWAVGGIEEQRALAAKLKSQTGEIMGTGPHETSPALIG